MLVGMRNAAIGTAGGATGFVQVKVSYLSQYKRYGYAAMGYGG
jgi:hypothetical protein